MKQSKKIISLIITLAMLISAVSVLGLIPASAAAGDSFTLNSVPASWKWFTQNKFITKDVTATGTNWFAYSGGANSGKSFDDISVLLCNDDLTKDVITANTHYRLEFDMETWYTLSALTVKIGYNLNVWNGTTAVTHTYNNLTNYATNVSGNASNIKLKAHITFDVTAPSTLSGNQHFVMCLIPTDSNNSVSTTANLQFYSVTVTELKPYTVKDSGGNTLGTVYGLEGDDTAKLFDASGINSDNLTYTNISPATIGAETTEITVTYDTVKTIEVYDADGNTLLGTVNGQLGDDLHEIIENSAYNYPNSRFTVSPATVASDTTRVTVTYQYSHEYDVYDEDGNNLGTVTGFVGDDCYALTDNPIFKKDGFAFDVDPEVIEDDTENLVIYYYENYETVQNIDFGSDYAGGNRTWHYGGANDNKVTFTGSDVKFENPAKGVTFGNRAVLLANNYQNSGLIAGKTYRLAFDMKFWPRYKSFDELTAEIHFGKNAYDNHISGSEIVITGKELENSATSYYPSNNGAVTFRIERNITLPVEGWVGAERNVILSFYGGEVWLDNVVISTLAEIPLVDANNNSLGSAFGKPGDTVAKILPASLFSEEYNVTATPATVENVTTPIVVTKTLKSNIADIAYFGSFTDDGGKHFATGNDAKIFIENGHIKVNYACQNNSYGYRSFILSNSRWNYTLTPGKEYAVLFTIGTWNNLTDINAQIGFGNQCWYGPNITISGADFAKSVISSSTGSNGKTTATVLLKFTVPSDLSGNQVASMSLFGSGNSTIFAYVYTSATILSQSEVTVKNNDASIVATAKGYAGQEIGDVFSETSNVKFVGITDKFDYEDTTIRSNKYISRGDVNADFNLDSLDLGSLKKYILGMEETVDTFGANVNATTLEDSDINLLDLVSLKKKLANQANELDFLTQNNYALAWSYDFNDANIDGNYIDTQWGENRNVDDIEPVTAGEKQFSYVKDGCLVLAPSDNYGAGKTLVCDAYTTKTTMNFTYGYLEVMSKLPFSSANTPAIWLKSVDDNGHLFEIDLVETFGSTSSISTNIHYWEGDTDHNLNNVGGRSFTITNTEDFHKYGFEWYKENGVSKISFYVDGNLVKTVDASMLNCGNIDFNENMYLIIENIPVTQARYDAISDWAGSATVATHNDYPMNAYFDYIKLYQSAEQTDSVLWTK